MVVFYFLLHVHVLRWVYHLGSYFIVLAIFGFIFVVCKSHSFLSAKFPGWPFLFAPKVIETWTRSIFLFFEVWSPFFTNLVVSRFLLY